MTGQLHKKFVIAFVSDAVLPFNKGGKETRLWEITTRLTKRGYSVHIYTMNWWHGKPTRVIDNITYHALCRYYPLYSHGRRSVKEGVIFALACLKLLFARFDILDADSMPYFPLYTCKLVTLIRRKKLVAAWHEVWTREYWQTYLGKIPGTIAFLVEKGSAFLPDTVIANSELTENRIRSVYGRTQGVVRIEPAVDLEAIRKAKPSRIKSDVIFAGRLLKHKNVDLLIRALARVRGKQPGIRGLIVGEGPEKRSLQALTEKLGLGGNVRFLPFTEIAINYYGLLKSSKILALLSSREGYGMAVNEALACGLKIITCDYPDNAARLLVSDNIGAVVRPEVESIATAILNSLKTRRVQLPKMVTWEYQVNKITDQYTL
jgi:glycosyltransferase involved in cell wall biosynthesis